MATNFFGMVRMVRACVPVMKGECRRVVNVGSIGGRIGLPYQARLHRTRRIMMYLLKEVCVLPSRVCGQCVCVCVCACVCAVCV